MEIEQKTLVIIPARNESKRIHPVIRGIWENIPECEILVVEDGSTDNTVEVVKTLGARIVSLPINLGYGGALRVGFQYALSKKYRYVVSMDADGQHDPNDIVAILKSIYEDDNDLIIGSRFLGKTTYSIPIARRIGMFLFSKITSTIVGNRITDTTSGFMAIGPKALPIVATHCATDFPNAELICIVSRHGMRVSEIPILIYERNDGVSMFTFWKAFYYPFKLLLAISMVLLRKKTV